MLFGSNDRQCEGGDSPKFLHRGAHRFCVGRSPSLCCRGFRRPDLAVGDVRARTGSASPIS